MPIQLAILLLALFSIHFVVFLRLYFKRKDRLLLGVACVFMLLLISVILRKWLPEMTLGGIPLFWLTRFASWGTTAGVILLRLKRRKSANN
jgi:peptidoglycan/LPS O-acetylase OafA/YrhL